jgi:putative addiction module component (TIGR02574 family)
MATAFEKVAEQARSLNAAERLRLANQLLQSVEPQISEQIEQTWEAEIQRRISQIDSGNAEGRTWEEIKRDFDLRHRESR